MAMTVYGYKCPECQQTYTSEQRGDRLPVECHICGHSPLHRDYRGIAVHRPMLEHMNATVGKPISDMKQFKDELARKSEQLSEYTQVEQRLEVLEPEAAKQGVTEEGLDSTNRVRVSKGLSPIKL